MSPKVLIAVTDQQEAQFFESTFQAEGNKVLLAGSGIKVLVILRKHRPDFIILDPALTWMEYQPQSEGISPAGVFIDSPLMFLNMATSEILKIWPVKNENSTSRSFNAAEVIAQLNAMWLRIVSGQDGNILRAGALQMDIDDWTVSVDGKMVELTGKEFGLLRMLLSAKGRVLRRNVLHESVWDFSNVYGIESRTVDVHIGRLRRKLGPAGGYIITVRGLGYRFGVLSESKKYNRNHNQNEKHNN